MQTRSANIWLCIRLFLTGCLWAGLFGVLHNQLSCTLSPEYFTHFKFQQFGLPQGIPVRLGAAWVGWAASWWVGGMIAGALLFWQCVILRVPVNGPRNYRAFRTALLAAFLAGQSGLLLAELLLRMGVLENLQLPLLANLTAAQRAGFIRAGVMHDASYLGGLIGLLIAGLQLRRGLFGAPPAAVASPADSREK